ncbi:MAG: nuclear transport factor 2 family protein [Jatrophihabitantaceae bacterium]
MAPVSRTARTRRRLTRRLVGCFDIARTVRRSRRSSSETTKNFDAAMAFIADDIVCDTPGGTLDGAEAFRAFMEPFATIVTRAELIASFGDQRSAELMYDTDSAPVPHALDAEFHRVQAGKITRITIIVDRQPLPRYPWLGRDARWPQSCTAAGSHLGRSARGRIQDRARLLQERCQAR